jgi:hypothetical protein
MPIESMLRPMVYESSSDDIPEVKRGIVKNLYLSDIAEEFIAMQVDLDIPAVIKIIKGQNFPKRK